MATEESKVAADKVALAQGKVDTLQADLRALELEAVESQELVDANARPAAVHFVSVSEFFSSNPNYFTAELGDFGKIALKWGPTARGRALVGDTQGGGAADPGPTDLSKRGLRPNGTT